jgi:type III pantothenate kinase
MKNQYTLAIDFGNTLVKLAVCKKDKWKYFIAQPKISEKEIRNISEQFGIKSCIISSVTQKSKAIEKFLSKKIPTIILNEKTKVPVKNLYDTQSSLGKDRLACAVAAMKIFPNKNVLVVNCGTCITYDIVNAKNEYFGGAISPGIEMRLKSLNTFTANLPLIKKQKAISLTGNSTESSILSGVIKGAALEIDGFISEYKKSFSKLKVILSGGDAEYFGSQLKNKIFARPNIVLTGLNQILLFNEQE